MTEEAVGIRRTKLIKWIKALACFLVFMWMCTIISRSIYASKLTRVKSEEPSEKYIEHKVKTDGIVEAGGEQAVTTLEGLRVGKVYVRVGDRVEAGDLLFEVDLNDLATIIGKKEDELAKQKYYLADDQFNEVLAAQKKEIQKLWAKEDYENAQKETAVSIRRAEEKLSMAQKELQEHLKTTVPVTSDEDRQKAWDAYNKYRENYYGEQDKVSSLQTQITELEIRINQLNSKKANEVEDGSNPTPHTGTDNHVDTALLDEWKQELALARDALAKAQNQVTDYERNPITQPDYSTEKSAYDSWQIKKATLEDAVRTAQQSLEDTRQSAANTLRNELRDVATAETLSPSDSAIAVKEMEIAQLQAQLQLYYTMRDANGKVTAPRAGYVLELSVRTGSRTADTPAVMLSVEEDACFFKFTVDKEQSKYIRLGSMVDITLYDTNMKKEAIEAEVTYLSCNQQNGYDMTCKLPEGIGLPNINGTITKTVQGEKHKLCIPIEALHQENHADYVFLLEEKEGILGKEYYVEKLKVQVLDKNDRYAALEEGSLDEKAQVITFSSKEIKQGESVRPS